jgi:hypothetical protein
MSSPTYFSSYWGEKHFGNPAKEKLKSKFGLDLVSVFMWLVVISCHPGTGVSSIGMLLPICQHT